MAKALDDLWRQEMLKFPGVTWPDRANFPDVPDNHWASPSLMRLKAAGVCEGFPDGLWRGDRPVSKYELYVQLNALVVRVQSLQDLVAHPFQLIRVAFRADNSANPFTTNDLPSTKMLFYRVVLSNRLAGARFRFSKDLSIHCDWSIPPSSRATDAKVTISSQGPDPIWCDGQLNRADGTPYVDQKFTVTVSVDGLEVGRGAVYVGR